MEEVMVGGCRGQTDHEIVEYKIFWCNEKKGE